MTTKENFLQGDGMMGDWFLVFLGDGKLVVRNNAGSYRTYYSGKPDWTDDVYEQFLKGADDEKST